MAGIPLTIDQITAQMESFWAIPAVSVLVSAMIAVGLVVFVVSSVLSIFWDGWN